MVRLFTVMGSGSEQQLARLVNAMRLSRDENERLGEVTDATAKLLADELNNSEQYLMDNEQFVDRLERRGDMS